MLAIQTKELTRRFGDFTAVNKASITVEKGEVFGFLGPNGSGKTTVIKMLTGIRLVLRILCSGGTRNNFPWGSFHHCWLLRSPIGRPMHIPPAFLSSNIARGIRPSSSAFSTPENHPSFSPWGRRRLA
jgi:hypothetical protein